MDGTFGGGDLISASLAIMLGGNGDAELHDKEVTLTTSDVTGSQTAIFEYDPQNEPTTGTPPGPWDGYSLFTIDLSGVKDDLEDLQQHVSDLENELEACHDCRDEVVAFIQQYIPDYDPQPDECPADEMPALVQAVQPTLGSKFITANGTYLPASDNLDGYNQVVVDVPTWESCIQTIAAKLGVQEPYDCQDIVDAVDEHEGYEFDPVVPIDDILAITAGDVVTTVPPSYDMKVYIAADKDGVHYEGKRVIATSETGDLSATLYVDVIDHDTGTVVGHQGSIAHALHPQYSSYLEVGTCSLSTGSITVVLNWYRSDSGIRNPSYTFMDNRYPTTGPYKVTK